MSKYSDYKDKFYSERVSVYSENPFFGYNAGQGKLGYNISEFVAPTHGAFQCLCSKINSISGEYLYFHDANYPMHLSVGKSSDYPDKDRLEYFDPITGIECLVTWSPPIDEEYLIRVEYSPDGNKILVNGNEPEDLEYIIGGPNTQIYTTVGLDISSHIDGIVRNVKLFSGDDEDPILHFPLTVGARFGYDTIEGLPGWIVSPHPKSVGYYQYPTSAKWGKTPAPITTHPFKEFPVSGSPRDEEVALFNWKDTGLPAISPTASWSSHTVDDVVRNEQCWCHSKALTCMSVLADLWGFRTMVTLLSPRHVIIAEHVRDDFSPNNGTPYATGYKNKDLPFMDMDNNIQIVRGIDSITIGFDYENGTFKSGEELHDTAILLLSEPITLDVEYAKLLPEYFANSAKFSPPRAVGPSKEGIMAAERMYELLACGVAGVRGVGDETVNPEYGWSRYPYNNNRVGDSSRPTFIYNGDELLLCQVSYTTGHCGYEYGRAITNTYFRGLGTSFAQKSIQKAMNELDDRNGYTEYCKLQVGDTPIWD